MLGSKLQLDRPAALIAAALLSVALLSVALLTASGAAWAASPPPTVTIVSPVQGMAVEGTVSIRAAARAAPGEQIDSVTFYDGVNEIGSVQCQSQETCEAAIDWKATGLSGPHTLTAKASQGFESSATSAAVTVMVVSPPPTVSLSAPANGSTVKGNVSVSVSGATDPSQVDYPTGIVVFDGVDRVGSIECQGQPTCQGSLTWHATGLSGPHSLTAVLRSEEGLTVTSAPVMVQVLSPRPTVRITSPSPGTRLGGSIVVSVTGATDPSQVDYPTSIAVFDGASDELGSISCQGQQTCSGSVRWNTKGLSGQHTLAAVIHTENGVSTTSPHVVVGGARGAGPPKRKAQVSCHLKSLHVAVRRKDHGVCILPGVPSGTRVAIQYRRGSGWSTAVRGRVGRGGRYGFTLRGVRRATYQLAILIAANRSFTTTRAPIGTLRIR